MFAGRSWALLPPALALIIRSAYLRRAFIRWAFLVLAISIFAFISFFSGVPWSQAAFRALQVLAFLVLTKHLLSGTSELRLKWIPLYPAIIQHMAGRYLRVIIERFEDIYYVARVRISVAKQSRIKSAVAALVAAMTELAILANQEFTIISARGALTHPRAWKVVPNRRAFYGAGDLVLLALILVLTLYNPGYIPNTPKTVKDLTTTISGAVGFISSPHD